MSDRCIHLWSWSILVLASNTHLFLFRSFLVLLVLRPPGPPSSGPSCWVFLLGLHAVLRNQRVQDKPVWKLEHSCSIWISWVTWNGSLWVASICSRLESVQAACKALSLSLSPNAVYGFVWMINSCLQITHRQTKPFEAFRPFYSHEE